MISCSKSWAENHRTAVVDLLVALISVLTDIIWRIMEHHWYAGAAMCKIVRYLQVKAAYSYVLS